MRAVERMGWKRRDMAYGTYLLETFSPGVEKRLCRFFESKNFGVCNAILGAKLAYQL